jgi:hypothetical protein
MNCAGECNFIVTCLNCQSVFIRCVVKRGYLYARSNSSTGRNAIFCTLRLRNKFELMFDSKLPFTELRRRFYVGLSSDDFRRARFLKEVRVISGRWLHCIPVGIALIGMTCNALLTFCSTC